MVKVDFFVFSIVPSIDSMPMANGYMVWDFILFFEFGCIVDAFQNNFASFFFPNLDVFSKNSSDFCETHSSVAMLNKCRGLIVPKGVYIYFDCIQYLTLVDTMWLTWSLLYLWCLIGWINLIWLTYAKNEILQTPAKQIWTWTVTIYLPFHSLRLR